MLMSESSGPKNDAVMLGRDAVSVYSLSTNNSKNDADVRVMWTIRNYGDLHAILF